MKLLEHCSHYGKRGKDGVFCSNGEISPVPTTVGDAENIGEKSPSLQPLNLEVLNSLCQSLKIPFTTLSEFIEECLYISDEKGEKKFHFEPEVIEVLFPENDNKADEVRRFLAGAKPPDKPDQCCEIKGVFEGKEYSVHLHGPYDGDNKSRLTLLALTGLKSAEKLLVKLVEGQAEFKGKTSEEIVLTLASIILKRKQEIVEHCSDGACSHHKHEDHKDKKEGPEQLGRLSWDERIGTIAEITILSTRYSHNQEIDEYFKRITGKGFFGKIDLKKELPAELRKMNQELTKQLIEALKSHRVNNPEIDENILTLRLAQIHNPNIMSINLDELQEKFSKDRRLTNDDAIKILALYVTILSRPKEVVISSEQLTKEENIHLLAKQLEERGVNFININTDHSAGYHIKLRQLLDKDGRPVMGEGGKLVMRVDECNECRTNEKSDEVIKKIRQQIEENIRRKAQRPPDLGDKPNFYRQPFPYFPPLNQLFFPAGVINKRNASGGNNNYRVNNSSGAVIAGIPLGKERKGRGVVLRRRIILPNISSSSPIVREFKKNTRRERKPVGVYPVYPVKPKTGLLPTIPDELKLRIRKPVRNGEPTINQLGKQPPLIPQGSCMEKPTESPKPKPTPDQLFRGGTNVVKRTTTSRLEIPTIINQLGKQPPLIPQGSCMEKPTESPKPKPNPDQLFRGGTNVVKRTTTSRLEIPTIGEKIPLAFEVRQERQREASLKGVSLITEEVQAPSINAETSTVFNNKSSEKTTFFNFLATHDGIGVLEENDKTTRGTNERKTKRSGQTKIPVKKPPQGLKDRNQRGRKRQVVQGARKVGDQIRQYTSVLFLSLRSDGYLDFTNPYDVAQVFQEAWWQINY